MTQGGYRRDGDEWPPQQPRHASAGGGFDPIQRGQSGAADSTDPGAAALPLTSGVPWYDQRPTASHPPDEYQQSLRQRYPDAYVDEMADPRADPLRRRVANAAGRPADGQRGFERPDVDRRGARPDDGRLRFPPGIRPDSRPVPPPPAQPGPRERYQPSQYQREQYQPEQYQPEKYQPDQHQPEQYQPQRYEPQRPPSPGPDVRTTGQMPIFGPGAGPRAYGPDPRRPIRPPYGPGQPPDAFSGDPRSTGTQPRAYYDETRQTGEQPFRTFGANTRTYADPRMTDTQARVPTDVRTTGSQARIAADPRTTGSQPRLAYVDPATSGSRPRLRDGATNGAQAAVAAPDRRRRTLTVILATVLVLVIVAAGLLIFLHYRSNSPSASGQPSAVPSAIANRTVDATPLTAAEVFGRTLIRSSAAGGSYQVVKSVAEPTCANAAAGTIATALTAAGCNQAVRATMMSPDQQYVITAGVLNISTAAAATRLAQTLQSDISSGKGRLNGLDAGGTTTAIATAQARVAWDTRGHYLIYSVIAGAGGKAVASTDSRIPLIITDVVENYLGDSVVGARAKGSAAASPAAS
jgi:hypothetical protein